MPTTDERKKVTLPRVLIVDDDPLIRDLVRTVLEDYDYVLEEARDGTEALDMARERCPDVVVLDVMMPGADGYQVAVSLRRDIGPDCVIIMLSAKDQDADKEKGFRSGANAYFTKPFSPLDLLDAISAAVHVKG